MLHQYSLKLSFVVLALAWMSSAAEPGRSNDQAVSRAGAAENSDSRAQAKSESADGEKQAFRVWAIRYQIKDVNRAIAFYTQHLGFKLEQQQGAAFARISNGNLSVLLSGPGSSGSRPMPDGRRQQPGGWNRIVLQVDDLSSVVTEMKKSGFHFRNEIETGPGGKQIQLEDPDGNAVELFQPAS